VVVTDVLQFPTREFLNRRAVARLLAAAAVSVMPRLDLDPDDPADVDLLAGLLDGAFDDDETWAGLAGLAGTRPPGSSDRPGIDPPDKRHLTKRMAIVELRRLAESLVA
jgi:hypothetical protein